MCHSPHPSGLILLTVLSNSPTDISALWEDKQHFNQHLSTLNNCHRKIHAHTLANILVFREVGTIVLNHLDEYHGHLSHWQALVISRWRKDYVTLNSCMAYDCAFWLRLSCWASYWFVWHVAWVEQSSGSWLNKVIQLIYQHLLVNSEMAVWVRYSMHFKLTRLTDVTCKTSTS